MQLEPYVNSELVESRNQEFILECKKIYRSRLREAVLLLGSMLVFVIRFANVTHELRGRIYMSYENFELFKMIFSFALSFLEMLGFVLYLIDMIKVGKDAYITGRVSLIAWWILFKPLYFNRRAALLKDKGAEIRSVLFGCVYTAAWMWYLIKLLEIFLRNLASCG